MTAGKLHVTRVGEGPGVVLLHGLGLHSSVWTETACALAARHTVTCIDLPGHGHSPAVMPLANMDGVADALAASIPGPATWVGWSLGGLYALNVALRHPNKVERLILVSSTPRFSVAPDWPLGLADEIFTGFGIDYGDGFADTIRRFLTFQVKGSAAATKALRGLFSAAASCPTQANSFREGVMLLHDVDLRSRLGDILCPVRFIMGEKDSFVPATLGEQACQRLREGSYRMIAGAGHAPFLSHPDQFLNELMHALSAP